MSGDNFTLCFNAMKEEIKSLAKIQVCLLTKGSCSYMLRMGLQNLEGCSQVMLNDIKLDFYLMILLKREALIVMV
jgi:hypothetical protein